MTLQDRALRAIAGARAGGARCRPPRRASWSSTAPCRRSGAGPMVAAFEKATGIKVLMTRKSSGEFYAQIKAEAANPRGDIWWGGTGDPHLQAAEEGLTEAYKSPQHGRAAGLGGAPVGGSRRAAPSASTPARSATATTPTSSRRSNIPEPKCWADLDQARVQGRDPGRQPELVGHVVHDARDARAADGRGQGVRVPEGAAQEHQPVHEVGRGAGARGGDGREPGRHHLPARRRGAGGRRRAGEDRVAVRGHRLRDRQHEHHQGRQEHGERQEVVRLGALRRGAGDRRAAQGELPGAVEQERAGAARRRRSSPRSSSSTTTSRSTARRPSARAC